MNIMTESTAAVPVEQTVDSGRCHHLLPPAVHLGTYSFVPNPVIGCLPVTVPWNKAKCQISFFIMESDAALLSTGLINGLRLCFKSSAVQRPLLLSWLLLLCPRLLAVQKVLWIRWKCLRLLCLYVRNDTACLCLWSVQNAVTAEIQRLLHAGVSKRMDAFSRMFFVWVEANCYGKYVFYLTSNVASL